MATTPTTITPDSLTVQDPLKTITPTTDMTNYQSILDQQAAATKSSLDTIAADNKIIQGKTADTANFNSQYGVDTTTEDINKYTADLAGINANISGLANEAKAIPLTVQQNNQNTGATDSGVLPQTTGKLRENAIKALTQSSLADILTANITGSGIKLQAAKDKVTQAINLKYKPLEDEVTALQNQLKLNKDYITDPAEKKLASAQQRVLDERARVLAEQKQNDSDISKIAITAATNKAPQAILDAIQQAKTPIEAAKAAAGWLQDPLDAQYKKAQIAKINADIASSGASGIDAANVLAYAQQYASTGTIPTGLPKGTFGIVAQYAKEQPKPDGTLVDRGTGVKSGAVSPTQEEGIIALKDVTQKLAQLKDMPRLGGPQTVSNYNILRGEIVDLIARARSGAALTANEEATYKAKIPKITSFIGDSKIDALQSSITGKLDTELVSKGLSIYGYSKVKVGDNDYTVGSIIQNANGQSGRINPDGSITIIN